MLWSNRNNDSYTNNDDHFSLLFISNHIFMLGFEPFHGWTFLWAPHSKLHPTNRNTEIVSCFSDTNFLIVCV